MESIIGKVVSLPVVTGLYNPCGNAAQCYRFDVVGMSTVLVCNINEGLTGKKLNVVPTGITPGCSGNGPVPDDGIWNSLPNQSLGMWVKPLTYAQSGVFGGTSECKIGDTKCDFGTRAVTLYR